MDELEDVFERQVREFSALVLSQQAADADMGVRAVTNVCSLILSHVSQSSLRVK
jgi:hypothetical protein